MTHKSIKYRKLIETARLLFWKHGFKRVTIEEICEVAGVSKMTFYRYFPNKIELAKVVFNTVIEDGLQKFVTIFDDDTSSAFQKMEKLLQLKMEGSNDISREFLADFYSNPELGLSEHVEVTTKKVWEEIIRYFRKAQQQGWLRKDFDPEGLFIITTKLSELLKDDQLIQLYESPQHAILELARFFTYGIMPVNHISDQ